MSTYLEDVKRAVKSDKPLDVTIVCGPTSRENMDKIIKLLPRANIKRLTLQDFNHRKVTFLKSREAYTFKVLQAIGKNTTIETLELSKDFTQYCQDRVGNTRLYVNLRYLLNLPNLTTLIIDNSGWCESFIDSLSVYLTHPNCTLQHLQLKDGLTSAQIDSLDKSFRSSSSLISYSGPAQKELQAVIPHRESNDISTRPSF